MVDDIRSLKIAHVCGTSTISGANRYAFDLAAGQTDLGHRVSVHAPKRPGDSPMFRQSGTKLHLAGAPNALMLLRNLQKEKPDIIHLHDALAARWVWFLPQKPPILMTLHNRYKPKYMSWVDGIHAIVGWQAEELENSNFRGPRTTILNWTPSLPKATPDDIQSARIKAGAKEDTVLIGYLGQLSPVKAVDRLIRAFKAIDKPNYKLAIIGSGSEEPTLKSLASDDDRISFQGSTRSPAIWYNAFDLLVTATKFEAFALVGLEAMATQTPILTPKLPCFEEMFADTPDVLVDVEETEVLAEAIISKTASKKAGEIQRTAYDVSRFDRTKGVKSVTDFYSKFLS